MANGHFDLLLKTEVKPFLIIDECSQEAETPGQHLYCSQSLLSSIPPSLLRSDCCQNNKRIRAKDKQRTFTNQISHQREGEDERREGG